MDDRTKRLPEAKKILTEFRREKEELYRILDQMRAMVSAAERSLLAVKEESAGLDEREAWFSEVKADLEEERRLRVQAQKAQAESGERILALETENAALLADKQTLLKNMLKRR